MFPNLENTYESGFGALRRHVVSHHSSFFPNIMKTFKHIAKSKEFCSPHSFSHHVDSTTNILVYLLYHRVIHLPICQYILIFSDAFQSELQTLMYFPLNI